MGVDNLKNLFSEIRLTLLIHRTLKRFFDLVATILGLPALLGIIGLLYAVLYLHTGRPVFFRQKRYGRNGQVFTIYKFRTMVLSQADFADWLAQHPEANEEYERYKKLIADPRVTPFGIFLRKFSLDELPQFINILKGEMSLVGPRPYTLDELHPEQAGDALILSVPPGITGWWQVNGRNEITFEERKELDRFYARNWTFWMDLIILLRTPWVILHGTGR